MIVLMPTFTRMKKVFTLILCLLFTFVTFGGAIYVHNCGENTLLSIYEKTAHEHCPMCPKGHPETKKSNSCLLKSCNDVEIKIDQLSDQLFSSQKADTFSFSHFIFPRYWVNIKPLENTPELVYIRQEILYYISNSSPPIYILHRNIRN